MGNNQNNQNTKEIQGPNINQWKRKRQQETNIWYHVKKPNVEIEEYQIQLKCKKDKQVFNRIYHLRNYHQILVSSLYYTVQNQKNKPQQSCVSLFLQRIPFRLDEIGIVKFPQVLHLYYNVFVGYLILTNYMNCFFRVSKRMIGVNNQGVIKIWLHQNFEMLNVKSIGYNQQKMVQQILNLLEQHTELNVFTRDMHNQFEKNKSFVGIIQYLQKIKKQKQIHKLNISSKLHIPKPKQCSLKKSSLQKSNSIELDHTNNTFIKDTNFNTNTILKSNQFKPDNIKLNSKSQASTFQSNNQNNNTIKSILKLNNSTYNQNIQEQKSFRTKKIKFYQNPYQTAILPPNISANSTLTAELPSYYKKNRVSSQASNFFKPLRMATSEMQQNNNEIQQIDKQYNENGVQIMRELGLQSIIQNYRQSMNQKNMKQYSTQANIKKKKGNKQNQNNIEKKYRLSKNTNITGLNVEGQVKQIKYRPFYKKISVSKSIDIENSLNSSQPTYFQQKKQQIFHENNLSTNSELKLNIKHQKPYWQNKSNLLLQKKQQIVKSNFRLSYSNKGQL